MRNKNFANQLLEELEGLKMLEGLPVVGHWQHTFLFSQLPNSWLCHVKDFKDIEEFEVLEEATGHRHTFSYHRPLIPFAPYLKFPA